MNYYLARILFGLSETISIGLLDLDNFMTTRQLIFALLLVVGAFAGCMGYCYVWADWMDDVQTGVYQKNYLVAAGKTSALGLYTYFAIRFVKRNVML